jgi:tetratricopeptide (TPR) repeat protein
MKRGAIYLALLCGLSLLVWRLWPRDADYYYNRGVERLQPVDEDTGGDLDGALADFNRAIRLRPNFAAAYERRAYVKSCVGSKEAALADYKRAIALQPTNSSFYVSRASFWESRENFDAAIADLTRGIELSPKDYELYERRRYLWYKKGDFTGVMADMERASEVYPHDEIQLNDKVLLRQDPKQLVHKLIRNYNRALGQNPNFAWGYYHRAVLEHLANDPDGALADLERCSRFADPRLKDYAAIHIWLVRTQRGEAPDASLELSRHFSAREAGTPSDWEVQIARFLLGQINQEEFSTAIEGIDTERRRSQVWYYSAMKQLLAGNKTKAVEDFRKARLTETRPYAVEISAQIQLSMLDQ